MSRPPDHILYAFSTWSLLSLVDIDIQYSRCLQRQAHTSVRRLWSRNDSAVAVEKPGLGRVVPGLAIRCQHSIQTQSRETLDKTHVIFHGLTRSSFYGLRRARKDGAREDQCI